MSSSNNAQEKPAAELPMITLTTREAAHRAALTYAPAFSNDPVMRWVCSPSSASRPNLMFDPKFRYNSWHFVVAQEVSNSGIVTNIDGDWDSVGVYFVPGTSNDPILRVLASSMFSTFVYLARSLRPALLWRGVVTYPGQLDTFKKNYFLPDRLKKHDFYYVAALATLESRRGQGLASKFIKWLQVKATEDKKPIWLETSTAHAKVMYERCGFWVVDEVTLGAGEVDNEGLSVKKGREGEGHEATGVKLWALIWWPPGVKEERKPKAGENP